MDAVKTTNILLSIIVVFHLYSTIYRTSGPFVSSFLPSIIALVLFGEFAKPIWLLALLIGVQLLRYSFDHAVRCFNGESGNMSPCQIACMAVS